MPQIGRPEWRGWEFDPAGRAEAEELGMGVTGALYRPLCSTNAIENLNGLVGHFVRNVRRWCHGAMLVRWIATGLQDAQSRFRRIKGRSSIR